MNNTPVQEYRNIRRTFLFDKALKKYIKNHEILTCPEIFTLMSFHSLGAEDGPVSVSQVIQVLNKCNHGVKSNDLYIQAASLMRRGLLIDVDSPVRKYKLSLIAINWLDGFEYLLRRERWNR